MVEELEPIDRNLQYDFNYQQINHLTREATVLPVSTGSIFIEDVCDVQNYYFQGDLIQLKCFYGTESVDGVTTVSEAIVLTSDINAFSRIHALY